MSSKSPSRKRLVLHRFFLFATLLMLALLLSPHSVFAATKQVIEFPEEELASESVLPVFDRNEATKNRIVSTAKRLEVGLFGSYSMTEPFYNPFSIGGMVSYHFNETHGLNLLYQSYLSGISGYSQQLNPPPNSATNVNLQYAPAPKFLMLANYQYTAFYGKVSLTKDYVMNLHLYGLLGGGLLGVGDGSVPVLSVGIGQKFYLTPRFALRFDLRGIAYNGPDVLSIPLATATGNVSNDKFDKQLQFGTLLSVGLIYLLPSF